MFLDLEKFCETNHLMQPLNSRKMFCLEKIDQKHLLNVINESTWE
ncbi:hypothetical protein D049_4334 [Vibrio parahaemolyticus VPTS-2010]|nr:hypothetical protein D049_4334 [Vibrio parahaemolyticus VPTS-2010]